MNLKSRIIREITKIGSVFVVLIVIISIWFISLNGSLQNVISQSDPTLDAMEHMLFDAYQTNTLLLDYVTVADYGIAVELDKQFKEAQDASAIIANAMQNRIANAQITDQSIIDDYNRASKLHRELQEKIDEILITHKQELATSGDFRAEKQNLLTEHNALFKQATNQFQEGITKITDRNLELRNRLLSQVKIYMVSVLIILIIFLLTISFKMRKLGEDVIQPLDSTINATQSFVDGNYEIQITPTKKIEEIRNMQENINHVFTAVKEVSQKNPKEKEFIASRLLKKENIDIIDYISEQNHLQRKVTISDIKKHFNITHPTVLTRLNELTKKGYISIEKEGREKFVLLRQTE